MISFEMLCTTWFLLNWNYDGFFFCEACLWCTIFFGKSLLNINSSNSFPHFLYKFFPDLKSFCTFSPVLQVCPVALWNCPFEILYKFFYYHAKEKKCNCSQIKLSWSHICFVEKHALTSLELMPLWCTPAFFIFCSFPLISTTLLTHYCLYWRCTWPSIRS